MADDKPRVFSDAEIQARLTADGLTGWYVEDGWLRRNIRPAVGQSRSCSSMPSAILPRPPGIIRT